METRSLSLALRHQLQVKSLSGSVVASAGLASAVSSASAIALDSALAAASESRFDSRSSGRFNSFVNGLHNRGARSWEQTSANAAACSFCWFEASTASSVGLADAVGAALADAVLVLPPGLGGVIVHVQVFGSPAG